MNGYEAAWQALPRLLLPWYQANARDLPWRQDKDPYHVWLSEIMLQQTRVEAVKAYYQRFLAALPNIAALAAVEEDKLLKLWQGLGYYNRARNLKKAAQQIMTQHHGLFPQDYAAIRALPGIGDYSAGAIASICFGQATPAVDGNVLRLLSRFFADTTCIDEPAHKKRITQRLAHIYPAPPQRGDFSQALMELGALVCLPHGQPLCSACPLQQQCRAYAQGLIAELPRRKAKTARRQEALTVFVLYHDGQTAIEKRRDHGLLAGLWQLPHVMAALTPRQAQEQLAAWGITVTEVLPLPPATHIFTHIEWRITSYLALCPTPAAAFRWANAEQLEQRYALPQAFAKILPPARQALVKHGSLSYNNTV